MSQNENNKWYFGNKAGLDFTTNPPTILTGSMNSTEGCSAISTGAGNLLFYTNGISVWNANHGLMPGPGAMQGNPSSCQSGVIVKRPGSNTIYYVFSNAANFGGIGLKYSTIDMSLAAGLGSITAINVPLVAPTTEQVTSVKHANGSDVWVMTRLFGGSVYHAYLVTAAGVNATPVVSNINANGGSQVASIKFSPNGTKLAAGASSTVLDIYDFNNATGQLSNHLPLQLNQGGNACWVEFSPDASKVYCSGWSSSRLTQFDLCAGSQTAIVASQYSLATGNSIGCLQLATNGKIYIARSGAQTLAVIDSPNLAGASCNFILNGQSIAPNVSTQGLPNFITSGFRPPLTFTWAANNYSLLGCQTASFTAPAALNTFSFNACSAWGYSLTGLVWNFGDPNSGSANTSTLTNPTHMFTSLGSYSVSLVLSYNIGVNDTIRAVVNISQPCLMVNSTSITCASLGSATAAAQGGVGPFSYTWMPTMQTSSVATGLSPGSYTITVFDSGNNLTYSAQTIFNSLIPLSGIVVHSSSLTCFGAKNGTAAVTNITGGSGGEFYLWANSVSSFTTPFADSLSAGIWSITVTDTLTGCTINQLFLITQPPNYNLTLSASSPTACVSSSLGLSGQAIGGTPFANGTYNYNWQFGPAQSSQTITQNAAGAYTYTLNISDSLGCSINNTIAVSYIGNPTLVVVSASICPLQTGVITVSGASSYTWNGTHNGAIYSDSPLVNTTYSVLGSTSGCSATATGSIFIYPSPIAIFNSNSPVCNGRALLLSAAGGTSQIFNGPLNFTSSAATPTIFSATPQNSGVYQLTVTSVHGCTASTSRTLTVNPTPTVTAMGSVVCSNGTLSLSGNSLPNASYQWSGPIGFNSLQQNPSIISPGVNRSGTYYLKVTSPVGCTNIATAEVTVVALPSPTISSNGPQCELNTINFSSSSGSTHSWIGPNNFNSSLQAPSIQQVTSLANGVYTLNYVLGPCTAQTTHSLTVYALPTLTVTNTGPTCETKAITVNAFTGNPVVSYNWQGPAFSSQQNNFTIDSVKLHNSGNYIVTVVDHNQCSKTATTQIVILQNPTVTAVGDTVCLNQPAIISASGGIQYMWTGPNFYHSNFQEAIVPVVSKEREGTYTVVVTAANSCTSVTNAKILTLDLPVPTLTVYPEKAFCLNEVINLSASGGTAYTWYLPENIRYQGQSISFTAVSPKHGGIYTLQAIDENGCTNTATTVLTINSLPFGSIAGKLKGCVPFCADYKFESNKNLSGIWKINGQVYSSTVFSTCFYEAGSHELIGSITDDSTGCENELGYIVEVFPKPSADFNFQPIDPLEMFDEVIFNNQSQGVALEKFSWSFNNTTNSASSVLISNSKNAQYIFNDAGIYPVVMTVENSWGCRDTSIKIVEVRPDSRLFIPNAFSPNNDGLNDVFLAVGKSIRNFEMQVYNRWGKKVFESNDISIGWDGICNGQVCKSEVYTWKVLATDFTGLKKELTGHVMLLR